MVGWGVLPTPSLPMASLKRRGGCFAWLALLALAAPPACAPHIASSVVDPVSVQIGSIETGGLFEEALDPVPQTDAERASRLIELFRSAGCPEDQISRSRVMSSRKMNLFCALPGQSDQTIVVGAHYDHTGYGIGLSDNWSGLAMLPLLYRALSSAPRVHGFVFTGFGAATQGQLGSESYLRRMRPVRREKIAAMVNLKGLGLGSTAVWSSQADPELRLDLISVSHALGVELRHVDLSRKPKREFRDDLSLWPINADANSFRRYRIPSIVIHSYSRETEGLLSHTYRERDTSRFDRAAYTESLRLVAVYLAYLDQSLAIRRERGD